MIESINIKLQLLNIWFIRSKFIIELVYYELSENIVLCGKLKWVGLPEEDLEKQKYRLWWD